MIYFAPIACAGIKFSNFEISDFVPADGHVRCSQRDFGTSGQQLAKLKVRSIPRMACARKKRVCLRAIVLVADRALSSGSLAMLAAIRRASSRVSSRCANGCKNGRFSAAWDEAPNSYAESDCNPARRYRKAGPVYQRTAAQFGAVKVSWHCWPVSSTTWVERSPISGCLQSSGASLTM